MFASVIALGHCVHFLLGASMKQKWFKVVKFTVLKACNSTMSPTEEKLALSGLHVNFAKKEKT